MNKFLLDLGTTITRSKALTGTLIVSGCICITTIIIEIIKNGGSLSVSNGQLSISSSNN